MPTSPNPSSESPPPATPPGHPGVGIRPTWEPWVAVLMLVVFVVFGAHVLDRSAYQERRKTDAGVFFRAGYAVRIGESPYHVPDDNEWYFLYPPGEAALFVPLADPTNPPLGSPAASSGVASVVPRPAGYLPYPVSVVLWYIFSVACLALAIECLARALLRGSPDPLVRAVSPKHGGWWSVRFWPLIMCLPDILSTLSRGQVNMVVLACVAGGIYLLSTGRKFWGGFTLAGAAFIKVFPGLLVLDILTRRGPRTFAGYAACGVATMILLPAIVFGPARAWDYTHEFGERVLLGGLMHTDDRLQAGTDFSDTDNQSVQGSLHNLVNMATPRGKRPSAPEAWVKVTHATVAVGLLAATLLIGRKRSGGDAVRKDSALEITLRIGMLCCVMILGVPMCHRHYYAFLLPAAAAIIYASTTTSRIAQPRGRILALVIGSPLLMAATKLSDEGLLRDLPIPLLINLAVWGTCAALLVRSSRHDLACSV